MAKKTSNPYGYQYGSEAEKYSAAPYRRHEHELRPSKRKRVYARPKTDWLFVVQISFCGMLVFTSSLSFVYFSSLLSSKQSQLQSKTKQLRETQSHVRYLETAIASKLNLEYIQQAALTQLHMSEPLPDQIVYIEPVKESYTTYPNQ